ncbi:unnamed protein product [Sphagnum balticum]
MRLLALCSALYFILRFNRMSILCKIPLKEGIGGEGGPNTGEDRDTLWITLMGDVFAVAGPSYPTFNASMPP